MAFGFSRPVLLAAVFAATAAAAIAGAAVRGESRDNPREVACAAAEWPMIPAECLEGGDGDVRVIDGDLRAHLPLIGGRIEKAAAPAFIRALRSEHESGRRWLEEHA